MLWPAGKQFPKRRDSIIVISLNDRAHTVFIKMNITLKGKAEKKMSRVIEV